MDHAASDGQIGHAGGMTEDDHMVVARAVARAADTSVETSVEPSVETSVDTTPDTVTGSAFDTCDGALAALGHVLEYRGGARWRLALRRSVPSTVPGADDPIEALGSADGSVPSVLEHLLAGVTQGQPLVPVVTMGRIDELDRVGPSGRHGRRAPRRRTHALHDDHLGVPADATIERTVRAIAVRAARTLVGLDPHLRLDALPSDVHEARIAVRRIRSELHAIEHLLRPGRTERLRAELVWFGEVLATVRDLDVVLDHLHDLAGVDAHGARLIRMRVRSQRRVAALVLRNTLASSRVRRLYDELRELATDPWLAKGIDPHRKARRAALEAVRITDRRLAGAVRSIGDPPGQDRLLEVRRRAKACRHVCELVAEPLGSGGLAGAMLTLQTTLGSLQDAVIVDAWLAAPHRPPLEHDAAGAAAALAARSVELRAEALAGWPAAWVRAQADALRPWVD